MPYTIPLPPGWGHAALDDQFDGRGEASDVVRSYDHRGFRLAWHPPEALADARRLACDIEHATRDAGAMAARFGPTAAEFLDAWVLTEVAAKLANEPILSWLKEQGLIRPGPAGEPIAREFAGNSMTLLLVPAVPAGTHIALGHAPSRMGRDEARHIIFEAPAHAVGCALT